MKRIGILSLASLFILFIGWAPAKADNIEFSGGSGGVINLMWTASSVYSNTPITNGISVPEPQSLVLLGLGLIGFGVLLRWKVRTSEGSAEHSES